MYGVASQRRQSTCASPGDQSRRGATRSHNLLVKYLPQSASRGLLGMNLSAAQVWALDLDQRRLELRVVGEVFVAVRQVRRVRLNEEPIGATIRWSSICRGPLRWSREPRCLAEVVVQVRVVNLDKGRPGDNFLVEFLS